MENIILSTNTNEDLKRLINEAVTKAVDEAVTNALKEFQINNVPENKDRLLTRAETAEMLHISLVTLTEYTAKGYINSFSLGGKRILYKESEIRESLKEIPIEKNDIK
jgi:predicted DNA-binding transcriptional regulator AlpA